MSLPSNGWKNKNGTTGRYCSPCGSWKNHWIKQTKQAWPKTCSVAGCAESASVGGHIFNPDVEGERIAPLCDACNGASGSFSLKGITVAGAVQC